MWNPHTDLEEAVDADELAAELNDKSQADCADDRAPAELIVVAVDVSFSKGKEFAVADGAAVSEEGEDDDEAPGGEPSVEDLAQALNELKASCPSSVGFFEGTNSWHETLNPKP